jgi:hypothetical protein
MNIPATSDPRTDEEIRADAEKSKGLESGTVLINGVPRNMRYFPPAPVETYAQYVKRVEGLVDFSPLTEAQWFKETHQLTTDEQMLHDLGFDIPAKAVVTAVSYPVLEVKVPVETPVFDDKEVVVSFTQELDIADYLNVAEPTSFTLPADAGDELARILSEDCIEPAKESE